MRPNISIGIWLVLLLIAAPNSLSTSVAQQSSSSSESDEREAKQNASDYLMKTEARIVRLEKFVTIAKSTADKIKIPFGKLMSTERDVKQIAQKLKLARAASEDIKVDSRYRAAINRRYNQLAKRLIDADEILWPLRYHLSSLLDPRAFPELKNDAQRLQGIANMFADPNMLESQPALAAEIFEQSKPAVSEFERVTKKYDRLIEQQTTAGRQLDGLRRYFESKHKSFLAAAESIKSTAPLQLKQEIGRVIHSLDSATSQPAIAAAVKSLPAQIASIDGRAKLLSALSAKDTSWQTDYKTLNAKRLKFVTGLQGRLLPSEGLPEDNYQAQDRPKIVALMKSFSMAQTPDLKLVSVRIPDSKWQRQTSWKFVPPSNQPVSETDPVDARWRREEVSVLRVCLLIADPANRDAVLVKRYRIERLPQEQRQQTDGSNLGEVVEISNSLGSDLRFSRPPADR